MNATVPTGGSVRRWLIALAVFAALVALLALMTLGGALVSTGSSECSPAVPAAGSTARGLFAAPLLLRPGRTYVVGATAYGGLSDPSSGSTGAIPDAGQSYLPAHPDSFAELSVLDTNPANSGSFTFADANALGGLPYLTALRVEAAGRRLVLEKRDIGYGQGPGQTVPGGEPYRLDLWWQAARILGVSKGPVRIALAPKSGAAATLEALPSPPQDGATAGCEPPAVGAMPLPLVPGRAARILPSGLAAAGDEDPPRVRAMLAAGNRLHDARYLYGGGHGESLDTLQPAYDCSSAVSFVLHAGGLLGASALDSTGLESFGLPGPGRWVSIYANTAHAFVYVAGVRLDTVEAAAYDSGPNAGVPGPKWRVSPTVPGWASWVIRHPAGL
ncbi:MAG: hypothetical protein JWM60_1681 [Solirubrobacterales bacterium]|nr:hypothetical protein [Solirubrobacterales bacterium]